MITITCRGEAWQILSVIKHQPNRSITKITSPSFTTPSATIILYKKLDLSLIELETRWSLKVIWTGIHDKERTMYLLSLPKTSTIHDLIGELSKQVQLTLTGTSRIRVFWMVKDGKTLWGSNPVSGVFQWVVTHLIHRAAGFRTFQLLSC